MPNRLSHAFGTELAALRQQRGATQVQIADAVGCTHGWVAQVENGLRPPTLHLARAAARYFGLNPTALVALALYDRLTIESLDGGEHRALKTLLEITG